jgi:hypothetical protein
MHVVVIGLAAGPDDAERLWREGADRVEISTQAPTLDTPEEIAVAVVRGAAEVRTRNVTAARRVVDVLAAITEAR